MIPRPPYHPKETHNNENPPRAAINGKLAAKRKIFMAAMMEYDANKTFAPDANSTLRVSYGQVEPYAPRDGMVVDISTEVQRIADILFNRETTNNS